MGNTKRVSLAIVFLVAGAIALDAAARKNDPSKDYPQGSCKLIPTGVEPDATGKAELIVVDWPLPYGRRLTLCVTCRHLTPGEWYGATYYAGGSYYIGEGPADKNGYWRKLAIVSGEAPSYEVTVLGDDGPILEGTLVPE